MTLVVGCASRNIGFLVGDTLVNFKTHHIEQKKPINGEAHTLKVRILNPDTAVAFATGDVQTSLDIIQKLQARLSAEPNMDTRVANARISGKLEYLQSHEASISPEEGRAGFSILASNTGARGIGIYYPRGKIGFLFIVGSSEDCRTERAETVKQFVEDANVKHGLNLG